MKKKIFAVFSCIILYFAPNVHFMQTAKASGMDIPGYVDEAAEAIFIGVATALVGVEHAGTQFEGNVKKLVDFAKSTYDTWSPAAKTAFLNSIDYYSGHINITADYLKDLFQGKLDGVTLSPEFAQFENGNNSINIPRGYKVEISILGSTYAKESCEYSIGCSYSISVYPGQYSSSIAEVSLNISNGTAGGTIKRWYSGSNETAGAEGLTRDLAFRVVYAINANRGLASFYEAIALLGGTVTITNLATGAISTKDELLVSDYPTSTRENYERAVAGNGLTLGLPTTAPYSNTGKTLEVTGTGVLLDGVPYTDEIVWKDVYGGGELVANLPLLYLDGKPLHWTTLADGTTGLVDSSGNVITDLSNVTTMPNELITINGQTYAKTSTGALINIKTGEIIAAGSTGVPAVPPVDGFASPTRGLDFSPLIKSADTLTTKFPFSVPWDVMRQLSVFNVEPQTPKFEVDVEEYLSIGNFSIPMKFDVDLSMFDVVAKMARWFSLIAWDIGLLLALRRFMPE